MLRVLLVLLLLTGCSDDSCYTPVDPHNRIPDPKPPCNDVVSARCAASDYLVPVGGSVEVTGLWMDDGGDDPCKGNAVFRSSCRGLFSPGGAGQSPGEEFSVNFVPVEVGKCSLWIEVKGVMSEKVEILVHERDG